MEMPRGARRRSESNLYHVMLRGNAQAQIFMDAEDNMQFLAALRYFKEICGYQIYAYCLMGNHVHLLIRVGANGEGLENIFRRIGARYVYWYNGKYQRVGHLFQARFKSEAVEDDVYLKTVLRYIHLNPVKAGIVGSVREYKYSSYGAYVNPRADSLVDVDFMRGMMDEAQFIAYHEKQNADQCMELVPPRKRLSISDARAQGMIAELTGCHTIEEFQKMPHEKRVEAIKELAEQGMIYRQISRLTGETYWFIQRLMQD